MPSRNMPTRMRNSVSITSVPPEPYPRPTTQSAIGCTMPSVLVDQANTVASATTIRMTAEISPASTSIS